MALLCFIILKKNNVTTDENKNIAPEKEQRTSQTISDDCSIANRKNDLKAVVNSPQASVFGGQSTTDPLPLEWEGTVIAVLNNNYQSGDERNKALIVMALQTAKHVPRVQQECLMHLAYGLKDDNYETFLKLSTDISIPLSVRLRFIDEVFSIRPKELTKWLGQSLRMTSDPALISRAQDFLKKQEEMELFYKSQPQPLFQDAEPLLDR
ncbi:MAG: hypothetical protein EBT07_13900 [Actinobacteria bacterium]|nr:hypothetical protein [Actinomycetota bacterium]